MKRILAIALALLFLGIPMALASPPAQEEVEGWHLVEELYMVPDEDVDVNGGPERFPLIGGVGLDYYQDSGEPDHVILSHWRTNEGGSDVWASCEWEVLLESPPPAYLPAGQPVSITVEHRVLETKVWEPPVLTAKFDGPDMELGYTSSSPNKFHHPYGEQKSYTDTGEEVYNRKVTMTTEDPIPEGTEGKRMAIYINYGWGYGMRYTYEWGVGYAATGEEESGLGAQNTAAPGSDRIFAPPAALATPGIQDIAVLWTSMNIYTVQNGAQDYYVIFALEEDSVVTELMTYHYLNSGAQPGELTLYAETGEEWGPFQAVGTDGQGGVKNACWVADTGELALPAGRYAIADSDPSTWSCNAESGYLGMAEVRGYVRKAQGNPFAAGIPNG